ncbi:zinc-binding dehydrogenase [Chloroflexota bacterium]
MKAAVMHDTSNIVIEEVPTPSAGSGELLLRVRATRVCGTDVNMYRGNHPGPFLPRILGHECAGEVVEVGNGVTGFNPGDRVGIDPLIYCGKCYFCRMGKNNLCENGGLMGREVNGSFAEFAIVTPERVVKIPDAMSFDVASYLEAVGSVYHSHSMAQLLGPGASVAVIGLGSIGMLHVQFAKLAGANPVVVTDIIPWKLDLALQLGADIALNAKEEDVVEALLKLTPHHGADVVIEAAGVPTTIRQSYEMVRPGGEIIQFGVGPTSMDNMNIYLQYYKETITYGVRAITYNDMGLAVKFLENQTISIEPIITHRFPLEQTAEALELAEKPSGKVLGIVVNS